MEQKPYETIEKELALAKDTLLNEVTHRQQLGAKLQDAANKHHEFQSLVARDLQDIRTAAKSQNFNEILAIVDRCIGPEPEEAAK